MPKTPPLKGRFYFAWLSGLFLLLATTVLISASGEAIAGNKTPYWVKSLPSSSCPKPWSSSDTYCHRASPVLADVTGDGNLEIAVATNRGHVQLYRYDGRLLWDRDVAGAFGMDKNKQRIASSPAVADIDADGRMEIVVGTGTVHRSICTQGGVIVLEHNGTVKKGWPFLAKNDEIPPAGCRDSVFSTPALGDLDKDGDMEIVFGGFDKRIYALDHNGRILRGFPPDSHHFPRFGWPNLQRKLGDTIWSSPALADLDGDGFLDIVIGTDEGNYDSRWQPVTEPWNCPYRSTRTQGYCGGSIYALDRRGKPLPGFPVYKLEIIQSTPALVDIDGDGRSEIFVGTGEHYYLNSPDHPKNGFRLFGLDSDGSDLPGWKGGKVVGSVIGSSPAIGDIDGDGSPEVVVTARDKKLYAYHLNGRPVRGFPMTPRNYTGRAFDIYSVGSTVILADYTGDGKMEIFVRHAWETVIIDGTGSQLTKKLNSEHKPSYVTDGSLLNSPAVGDLDGDGHLELVSQNSKLTVWKLPGSSDQADWPMLKQNASRSSSVVPKVSLAPSAVNVVHERGKTTRYNQQLFIATNLSSFDWTIKTNNATAIRLSERSGTVSGEETIEFVVRVTRDMPVGSRELGTITVTLSQNGRVYKTVEIPVNARVVRNLNQSYLPFSA